VTHSDIMILLFNQIVQHIKYHHNQSIEVISEEHSMWIKNPDKPEYRRVYGLMSRKNECFLSFRIKEDAGTRTSFQGKIFTFDQYLLIDQLAR
jgi:hypothetical protein